MTDSYEERLRRRFGGKIPEYLRKALGLRRKAQQRREDEAAAAKAAKEREFQRKRALRRPPARVWLERVGSHGMEVHWDPPETADELPPDGYWVNGDAYGDTVLPHVRSAFLRIYEPGKQISVETDYGSHQITKLGEHAQFSRVAEPPSTAVDDAVDEQPELPPERLNATHTCTIVAAARGSTSGYNRILGWGSIRGGVFNTPNGKHVTVSHARRLHYDFVLALSEAHQDAADFPKRIIATTGGHSVTLQPFAAERMKRVSGGVRRDYCVIAGDITAVFAEGNRVRLELRY